MNESKSPELVTAIENLTAEIAESNNQRKNFDARHGRTMRYMVGVASILAIVTIAYYILDYLKP